MLLLLFAISSTSIKPWIHLIYSFISFHRTSRRNREIHMQRALLRIERIFHESEHQPLLHIATQTTATMCKYTKYKSFAFGFEFVSFCLYMVGSIVLCLFNPTFTRVNLSFICWIDLHIWLAVNCGVAFFLLNDFPFVCVFYVLFFSIFNFRGKLLTKLRCRKCNCNGSNEKAKEMNLQLNRDRHWHMFTIAVCYL